MYMAAPHAPSSATLVLSVMCTELVDAMGIQFGAEGSSAARATVGAPTMAAKAASAGRVNA